MEEVTYEKYLTEFDNDRIDYYSFFQKRICAKQRWKNLRYLMPVFDKIEVEKDIVYTVQNKNLSLDIYQPAGDPETKRPVIIPAHGGVFREALKVSFLCRRKLLQNAVMLRFQSITGSLPDDPDFTLGIDDKIMANGWEGPRDLSAKANLKWDDDNLYGLFVKPVELYFTVRQW